ncbi:hypothetical protein TRFO_22394 [Tritrichomonas foetus]|uniref:PQ loop repeat family protein n=1 Tax=Tritrichomonas foetus TaxID=1144522 RepID=A0A1J4KDB6_9EUKA|nr:hypothetical protein TRFO_22394 [Tritrichomonas foetus]|eukprot:OHT08904.1 hypothetical protein TRFO_22394 [Tritrichomonas foetus]
MCFPLTSIHHLSFLMFELSPKSPYYVLTAVVIFAPTIGYFDQLSKIITLKSSKVFNKQTAAIQMLSNYLRFIYWYFEPYKIYLIGQSIAVFSLQIISSIISLHFLDKEAENQQSFLLLNENTRHSYFHHFINALNVFNVKTILELIILLLILGSIILLIFAFLVFLIGVKSSTTFIILLSNVIDTTTSFPLFIKVVIYHEIEGISSVLMAQFLFGDLMKITMYSIQKLGPFLFGAILQLIIDSCLIASYVKQNYKQKGMLRRYFYVHNDEPNEFTVLLSK